MRACATHPWRVVLSWLGIIVALFVLVLTVGGSLKDEFSIPGSDTQRATDLIEAEFVEEQGGVLNLVFAAPPGERLDTPERKAAIEEAIAELKTDEFAPTGEAPGRRRRRHERRRPLRQEHVLGRRANRVRGGAVRPRDLHGGSPAGRGRAGGCSRGGRAGRSRPSSSTATPSSRRSSRACRSCLACSRR